MRRFDTEMCDSCRKPWSGDHVCKIEDVKATLASMKAHVCTAREIAMGWDDFYSDGIAHLERLVADD